MSRSGQTFSTAEPLAEKDVLRCWTSCFDLAFNDIVSLNNLRPFLSRATVFFGHRCVQQTFAKAKATAFRRAKLSATKSAAVCVQRETYCELQKMSKGKGSRFAFCRKTLLKVKKEKKRTLWRPYTLTSEGLCGTLDIINCCHQVNAPAKS